MPSSGEPESLGRSNLQLSQNKWQSTLVTCFQCKTTTKTGMHTLRCLRCGESIHLKAYKDVGNEALRNKLNWLVEYIHFGLPQRGLSGK